MSTASVGARTFNWVPCAEGETHCGSEATDPRAARPGDPEPELGGFRSLLGRSRARGSWAGPLTALHLFLVHEVGMTITEPRSGLSRREQRRASVSYPTSSNG